MSAQAKAKLMTGLAFAVAMIVGMIAVSSFWLMVAGVLEADATIIVTNLVVVLAFCFILGYLLTSKQYRKAVKV